MYPTIESGTIQFEAREVMNIVDTSSKNTLNTSNNVQAQEIDKMKELTETELNLSMISKMNTEQDQYREFDNVSMTSSGYNLQMLEEITRVNKSQNDKINIGSIQNKKMNENEYQNRDDISIKRENSTDILETEDTK